MQSKLTCFWTYDKRLESKRMQRFRYAIIVVIEVCPRRQNFLDL